MQITIEQISFVGDEYTSEESLNIGIRTKDMAEGTKIQNLLGAITFSNNLMMMSLRDCATIKCNWNTLSRITKEFNIKYSFRNPLYISQQNGYSDEHYTVKANIFKGASIPAKYKDMNVGSVANGSSLYSYIERILKDV